LKEIILSAGAINTPQILLNSGVGDATSLTALGIPVVLDLPSVGQNASDHVAFQMGWSVNSTQTYESVTMNATRMAEAIQEWETSRMGPLVDSGISTHLAWLRIPANSSAFGVHADPSPGPGAPHIEFLLNVRSIVP
jgi:choline dehydrogenase-like flavoprotein